MGKGRMAGIPPINSLFGGQRAMWPGLAEPACLLGSCTQSRSLESEHRLAEVIGQMVGAAQQDGEAIARSIFREIFFRYGRVPLEPVGPRHFLKPFRQFTVYGFPCLANLFVRRNGGLGLVRIRDEGDIELGMKPISQPQ